MKREINGVSKKIVIAVLASATAFGLMGCSAQETAATDVVEETKSAEIVTYEFETFDNAKVVLDENSIVVQEPCEDPQNSELISEAAAGNVIAPGRDYVYMEDADYYYVADMSRNLITVADKSKAQVEVIEAEAADVEASEAETADENPGSFDMASWSISYDTDKWFGYIDDNGSVIINYLGEAAGTSYLEITEVDLATADEAFKMLEEKKGKELTVIDIPASETGVSGWMAYADDEIYEQGLYIADFYTVYEHNGKVIILDEAITHDDDDARAEALAEEFVAVKNNLVLK